MNKKLEYNALVGGSDSKCIRYQELSCYIIIIFNYLLEKSIKQLLWTLN